MKQLSDEVLIDTYLKARQLGLEEEFIRLLEREIRRRNLKIEQCVI